MITIFTPTYNREKTIVRTYNSLQKQTCRDFEWLIVDDGSTDHTEQLVRSWIQEGILLIRYVKQPNKGKYMAYNEGLRNAKSEFFMCVDSDDWLPENAVEKILSYADTLRSDSQLAGIAAIKEYSNHSIIGKLFRADINRSKLYHLECIGQGGERSRIFKTSVAKLYPFPEDSGEKFMTESVIYDRFEDNYEFLVTNDILTTCEYQPDGLSSNPKLTMVKNPAGYKLYFAQRIDLSSSLQTRISNILRYHAFRYMLGKPLYNYKGKHQLLTAALSPLGYIVAKLNYLRTI